jgi:hypothetical protein
VPKQPTIKQLTDKLKERNKFVDAFIKGQDKELVKLQKQLAELILKDYLPRFDTDSDGNIIFNDKNARLLGELNTVFDKFTKNFATDIFKKTGEEMLKLTGLTSEYYRLFNFSEKTLNNITDKLDRLQKIIGIDSKGKVIDGSYISRLAKFETVRNQISDYVRQNLEAQRPYKDFVKGFSEIVTGARGVDGALVKYSKNYIHDAMYTHKQAVDNFFAQELKMNDYFYYQGDEIETSRQFCIERHGKYFTRKEAEKWENECWPGKWVGFSFFDKVGGYNCRHSILWVTKAYYDIGEKATKLTKFPC